VDHARVRRAVQELPEAQRQVLELAYFEGLSSTEIAERLAIPDRHREVADRRRHHQAPRRPARPACQACPGPRDDRPDHDDELAELALGTLPPPSAPRSPERGPTRSPRRGRRRARPSPPSPSPSRRSRRTRLRDSACWPSASGPARFAPFIDRLARMIDVAGDAPASCSPASTQPRTWQPSPGPNVHLVHLDGGPAVAAPDAGFVRVAAGTMFPLHRHIGDEHVLVLQGSYSDSDGADGPRRRAGAHADRHRASLVTAGPERDLIYAVVCRRHRDRWGPGRGGARQAIVVSIRKFALRRVALGEEEVERVLCCRGDAELPPPSASRSPRQLLRAVHPPEVDRQLAY
jgi:hypothetical protein